MSASDPLFAKGPVDVTGGDEPNIDLSEYIDLIRRQWPLIAVTCAVATLLGVLHFFLTPKSYRATTQIQIEQRSLFPSDNRNPYLEAWLSARYYPTQYELLQSPGLAEQVVTALELDQHPSFNANARREAEGEGSVEADRAVVTSIARRLLGGVRISPQGKTELVDISYVSSDPQMAAKIANAWAEAYVDWGIKNRETRASRSGELIQNELAVLDQEIAEIEVQLTEYGRNTELIALGTNSDLVLQRLQQLTTDRSQAANDRIAKEAAYAELSRTPKETVADRESNGNISVMRRQLLQKEQEQETQRQTYTDNHPTMVQLRREIEEIRRDIGEEVDTKFEEARKRVAAEVQSARQREAALDNEYQKARAQINDQEAAAFEISNLQRALKTKKDQQERLQQQYAETERTTRLSTERETNVHIIYPALVPRAPFRPSLVSDLAIGIGSGTVLGVGIILLLHFLDRTVKTPEELEKLLGHPVLAVIPDVSEDRGSYGAKNVYGYGRKRNRGDGGGKTPERPMSIELLPETRPRLAVSEAYRSLRTALLLSTAEKLNVVTVTSAEASEGKTATAANLGVVMAQLGRKVLIIDADLRKPRQHQIFRHSNRMGLVNHLTGSAELEEIFLATSVNNLYLCPSGPPPPNPSELLASEKMAEFITLVGLRFDFVILDTPPFLAVADAALPASLADGVVLCFRANRVLREDVKACRDRLHLADVRVLGAVLNRYQRKRQGAYAGRYNKYYESYTEDLERPVSDSAA